MTPAPKLAKTCLIGSALASLMLCSACATAPSTQAWDGGYYNAVSAPVSRVNAMGPSAGIF